MPLRFRAPQVENLRSVSYTCRKDKVNFPYVRPRRRLPRRWRVPQLADISAQLLYIRNSQQLREARDSGDVDFYLRLYCSFTFYRSYFFCPLNLTF